VGGVGRGGGAADGQNASVHMPISIVWLHFQVFRLGTSTATGRVGGGGKVRGIHSLGFCAGRHGRM
jgi:hypothetical protein